MGGSAERDRVRMAARRAVGLINDWSPLGNTDASFRLRTISGTGQITVSRKKLGPAMLRDGEKGIFTRFGFEVVRTGQGHVDPTLRLITLRVSDPRKLLRALPS